jgi:hypothetical protein
MPQAIPGVSCQEAKGGNREVDSDLDSDGF